MIGKWKLLRELGRGKDSVVYEGSHIDNEQQVALKVRWVQPHNAARKKHELKQEYMLLQYLQRLSHRPLMPVPVVKSLGRCRQTNAIWFAMECLNGKSARFYVKETDVQFMEQDVCAFIDAHVTLFRLLHNKGFVHGDVALKNTIVVRNHNGGFSFRPVDLGNAMRPERICRPCGTPLCMSRQVQAGKGYELKDDYESLLYAALRLLWRRLPWERSRKRDWQQRCEYMVQSKQRLVEELESEWELRQRQPRKRRNVYFHFQNISTHLMNKLYSLLHPDNSGNSGRRNPF